MKTSAKQTLQPQKAEHYQFLQVLVRLNITGFQGQRQLGTRCTGHYSAGCSPPCSPRTTFLPLCGTLMVL